MKNLYYTLPFLLAVSGQAGAVGAFSRACSVAELAGPVKPAALRFFRATGASKQDVDAAGSASVEEQAKWWILESITADVQGGILVPRYRLRAKSLAYQKVTSFVIGGGQSERWNQVRTFTGEFSSLMIHDDLVGRYKDLFQELGLRRLGFFMRAGAPQLLEYFPTAKLGDFVVYGQHWFYDPASNTTNYMPQTKATNCNLTEWGWSWS